jgi:hypothetical protein
VPQNYSGLKGVKVARKSYIQMHGAIHMFRNPKLACHIHVSTVILPLLYHPDAIYHRKLQNKLYHLTWKSRVDIKYISFSSQDNDYLQIHEISQYPSQGHIRVKKNIWKNFNCIENIFFCKEIIRILKFFGKKQVTRLIFALCQKMYFVLKNSSIFGKLASSHVDLDGSIRGSTVYV